MSDPDTGGTEIAMAKTMNWGRTILTLATCATAAAAAPFLDELGPVPPRPTDSDTGKDRPALAAPPAPAELALLPVNLNSRETSRLFYRTLYGSSAAPPPVWGGDLDTCDPGVTEPGYRDDVALRINYYRAMAGLPAGIAFLAEYNTKAQAAALMISRNLRLDHYPTPDWLCYTPEGAEASARSNLALGRVGPGAIDSYMEDYGAANASVGHRRWLLFPQTRYMGSGDIPGTASRNPANVTWVLDENGGGARPQTREPYTAWPPPGYVPYPVVFPRWSFSLANADFTGATISFTSNGVPVAVEIEPLSAGAGENTIVWRPAGLSALLPTPWPRPDSDTLYAVGVGNVNVAGAFRSFSYQVTVFDPDVPGPDTVLPELAGPVQPSTGVPNIYTTRVLPLASGQHWLRGRREAASGVEGAEDGLGTFTATTSPGYDPVIAGVKASGNHSFHLAHPSPNTDQLLTCQRLFLVSPSSELRFKEHLGAATPSQTGRVELSLDDGVSWTQVYAHAGSNGGGLIAFQNTAVTLGGFAGRLVRLRFNYHHDGGPFYPQTEIGVGWYLDDIAFWNLEELADTVITELADASSFAFTPGAPGAYTLAARGEFLERYPLEWGPALNVLAIAGLPTITIQGVPSVSGGIVALQFLVSNGSPSLDFRLLVAPAPNGPWNEEPAATFTALQPGAQFRVSSPRPGSDRAFFRIRAL